MAGELNPLLRVELQDLVANMCKAINDPKRLLLLYALADGPRSVSELCTILDSPQSNASQHLAVLRAAGMVDAERSGSNVLYSLRHPKVLDAIDMLRVISRDELARRQASLVG
ncbi:MAG: metalloregulator ArsR/SmtB family transcription factor [Actinomycetota bacterium]